MKSRHKPRGLSMAEVLVSTALVSLLLVAALNSTGGVLKSWRAAEQRHDGLALAQQLLAEILQQNYEEPVDTPAFGIESPEDSDERTQWDDVDDYNGWSSAPEDKSGTALAGYESWTCAVTVALADVDDPTQVSGTDEGLKKIRVGVTDPTGQQTTLYAYRSKWGVLEEALVTDATVQTWVATEVEVAGTTKLHGGVNLENHAEDQ